MRDAAAANQPDAGETQALPTTLAQADAPPAANSAPEAEAMCILTAEDAPLSFSVVAKDADGDPLTVTASQPESGRTEVGPDGTLTFVADQPGVQTFQYAVHDGHGGADTANATVFVNPSEEHLAPPAMARIAPADLPALAQACASGIALHTTALTGPEIQIQDPQPGERFQIQAEPGQRIDLESHDFVGATYLVVDGGLLIVTPDGNMAYVRDFVRVAEGGDPPTLSVYEGPAVPADQLLAGLQPTALATVGQLTPPAAGPEHGGGAGFSPYDPGDIGTGPDALGPLAPTALALGTPPVHFESGVVTGEGEGNQPPTLTATPGQVVPVGEITVTPEFTSGHPFPTLAERQAVDPSQINGVDQGNFTLGPSADAKITFVNEAALFQDTLGVYLIDDNVIHSPKIVFPQIEQAEADPDNSVVRPGGGPLHAGDEVLLSQLYDPGQLHEGTQFGLFLIADGFTLNGGHLNGDLQFLSNGQPATIDDPTPQLFSTTGGDTFAILGDIYHSADPMPGDGLANPLNAGGDTQSASGLESGVSGLTATFEDFVLTGSDSDFNDTVVQVGLVPTQELNFGFVPTVSPDLDISDTDSGQLSRATVEITDGQSGVDSLAITQSLAGTGITALEDGSSGLVVLDGDAPIGVYESILQSVTLHAGGTLGERAISIQVFDDQGAPSDPVEVRYDFSIASQITGTDGADPLMGTAGNDPISGRDGDDQLSGLAGNDLMDGGEGDDFLDGGPGSDLLFGGPGNDTLTGGEGADRFFQLSLPDRGDQITDFHADQGDVLDLSALFDGQANSGNIDQFLQLEPSGANDVAVNADVDGGAQAFDFVQVATLVDPVGVSAAPNAEQQAVNSGAVAV